MLSMTDPCGVSEGALSIGSSAVCVILFVWRLRRDPSTQGQTTNLWQQPLRHYGLTSKAQRDFCSARQQPSFVSGLCIHKLHLKILKSDIDQTKTVNQLLLNHSLGITCHETSGLSSVDVALGKTWKPCISEFFPMCGVASVGILTRL